MEFFILGYQESNKNFGENNRSYIIYVLNNLKIVRVMIVILIFKKEGIDNF